MFFGTNEWDPLPGSWAEPFPNTFWILLGWLLPLTRLLLYEIDNRCHGFYTIFLGCVLARLLWCAWPSEYVRIRCRGCANVFTFLQAWDVTKGSNTSKYLGGVVERSLMRHTNPVRYAVSVIVQSVSATSTQKITHRDSNRPSQHIDTKERNTTHSRTGSPMSLYRRTISLMKSTLARLWPQPNVFSHRQNISSFGIIGLCLTLFQHVLNSFGLTFASDKALVIVNWPQLSWVLHHLSLMRDGTVICMRPVFWIWSDKVSWVCKRVHISSSMRRDERLQHV